MHALLQAHAPRDVTVAVQDQPAPPPKAIQELTPARELGRERPAEEVRQPLRGVLLGQRHDVVVQRDDREVIAWRLVERVVDGIDVLGQQQAVARDPRAVVVARRVHADDVQAVRDSRLHARARHDRVPKVVAEPVVVPRHDSDAPAHEQRLESRLEELPLAALAAMSDVARHDHVVDAHLDERARELFRLRVVLGAATHVQVGEVRQHPRPPNPPQVRNAQYFSRH